MARKLSSVSEDDQEWRVIPKTQKVGEIGKIGRKGPSANIKALLKPSDDTCLLVSMLARLRNVRIL